MTGRTPTFEPRTPRPEPHFNGVGAIVAATAAALTYLAALFADALPSQGFAVALFGATPVCAAFALAILHSRRRADGDEAVAWVTAGLAVGLVAMVLQFISFPAVAPGGGVLGTRNSSNGALYLLFHLSFAAGALCGAARVSRRWRRPFLVVGVALAVALARNAVPLPELIDKSGLFTRTLTVTELVVAGLIAASTVVWVVRAGKTPRSLLAWIGVALSFSVYDVALNAVAARRFDSVWWASLSLRVATYAVLAAGTLASVLRRLSSWERYTDSELDRREGQLRDSLATTEQLLAQATATSAVLQQHLLPHELVSVDGVTVTARYRAAGAHDRIGGDWYDTIPLPSGGLALVIGDVEGHDLTAASVMSQVRAAVRSYALEGQPPALVMQRVNEFLLSVDTERLVTMAYAQIYADDRLVTVAVAGHPLPLLVPRDGSSPHSMEASIDVPLGLERTASWTERTYLLSDDVTVVLYTDGLLDSPQSQGDALTALSAVAAAAAAGSVEELVDRLVESIPAPAYDDIAVLAFRLSAQSAFNARRALPLQPLSAGVARLWLADLFEAWSLAGSLLDNEATRDRLDVAQLLLTELVTNAIRHSDYAVDVQIDLRGTVLRVDVMDTSHRMPVLLDARDSDTSGRGLRLVATLAGDWGVEPREHGKSVWFTIEMAGDDLAVDEDALLAAFTDAEQL